MTRWSIEKNSRGRRKIIFYLRRQMPCPSPLPGSCDPDFSQPWEVPLGRVIPHLSALPGSSHARGPPSSPKAAGPFACPAISMHTPIFLAQWIKLISTKIIQHCRSSAGWRTAAFLYSWRYSFRWAYSGFVSTQLITRGRKLERYKEHVSIYLIKSIEKLSSS